MTKGDMDKAETICYDCPFRRDAERGVGLQGAEPAAWLGRYGWPVFEAFECASSAALCLGWAVHMANQNAHIMLQDQKLQQWILDYSKDNRLIFESNAEFIRYHRGEWFGSLDWFEDWIKRHYSPPDPTPRLRDGEKQGSLF